MMDKRLHWPLRLSESDYRRGVAVERQRHAWR
jgi:hypothetical protein